MRLPFEVTSAESNPTENQRARAAGVCQMKTKLFALLYDKDIKCIGMHKFTHVREPHILHMEMQKIAEPNERCAYYRIMRGPVDDPIFVSDMTEAIRFRRNLSRSLPRKVTP
ncbi:hypothetical protein EVB41_030 [Rhizobium phage RHph_TM3_14A]|nr:hypothetical protein EVB29_030 [Rhizobium phage RHph_TM27A]QIG66950.1 hypothetical protein EVB30_030 [Rhizobium phage RHph_TM27B]QIG67495.1 hypothetical protein EVB41_030 [Rhizobium phage RHph_TM3_14A]